MQDFIAAAIQMTSGDVVADNIAQLDPLLAEASAKGAQFVATPENTFYMRREGTAAARDIPMLQHQGLAFAQDAAKKYGIWLLIGSIRAKEAGMGKPYNRSILLSPEGTMVAYYDKLHLFDVTLPNGQNYAESSQAVAGEKPVVASMPFATLGLSICYDLRFPHLYRALALGGADMLAVPSAFTRPTGEAHWHVLLRSRAIENAAYVIAPAQCGTHPGGRETYGHSLIVDPWGTVVAERSDDSPGVLIAAVEARKLEAVRGQIPVLKHHREIAPL